MAESRVGLERDPTHWASVHVALADAELAMLEAAYGRALEAVDDLIGRLRRGGMAACLDDALRLRAGALGGLGRTVEAEAALVEARALAERLGSQRALWPALAAMGDLADARGDAAAAASRRDEAAAIVAGIADRIRTTERRAAFLSLPSVRRLRPPRPAASGSDRAGA